jgi:hypothetical protein
VIFIIRFTSREPDRNRRPWQRDSSFSYASHALYNNQKKHALLVFRITEQSLVRTTSPSLVVLPVLSYKGVKCINSLAGVETDVVDVASVAANRYANKHENQHDVLQNSSKLDSLIDPAQDS